MTIDEAIRMLEAKYNEALEHEWVHNKVAWALYQVWREADADDK